MKKKVLSIVLCLTLVLGCSSVATPTLVQAKKFSKKKVKFVKFKPEYFMLPEDDVTCDEVMLIINKNKKPAVVTFTIEYYNGKLLVKGESRYMNVAQIAYVGIGNDEELQYTSYKIKKIKIKKSKTKTIPEKKIKVKTVKKDKAGNKTISIKNKSKSNATCDIVNVFYNKKGKVVSISPTGWKDIKKGKKKKAFIQDKAYTGLGKKIKFKKKKTFYNYFKY